MKQGGVGVLGVEMGWIGIPRHSGKGLDICQGQGSHQACRLPHHDIGVGIVFKPFVAGVVGGFSDVVHGRLQFTAWLPAST